MRYQLFGRSGLRVSELCLGTMTFGNGRVIFGEIDWGCGADSAECRAIFDTFANAGGNFIDTAHLYMDGRSEKLVGDLIRTDRDHFVVSTKYTPSSGGDLIKAGNSRKNMMHCIEESLTRLQTHYVDIYWLHFWDSTTPIDEIMRGLDDLISSGKVHYIAISDTPAWRISSANMLADLRGWAPFIGIQIEYSLIERTSERDLLPMAKELNLGVAAFAALGGGVLSGKYLAGVPVGPSRNGHMEIPDWQQNIAREVVQVAREIGCTPSQVALAFVRQQKQYGSIIPILGARTLGQMEDNLACLNVLLDEDHLQRLDKVSAIDLGFPHEILRSETIRSLSTGDHFNQPKNL